MTQREEDIATFKLWTKRQTDPNELLADGAAYARKEIALQLRTLILPALYSGISKMELREFLEGLIERLESDE